MHQIPSMAHGFNHQSFYRQPVANLRQINEIVWNQNNEAQQMGVVMPPSISNQQFGSTDNSSKGQPRNTRATQNINQNRVLSRQSSFGAMPVTQDVTSQASRALSSSRSAGNMNDHIQRERRAHTMAPLTRILGPIPTPKANMFASIIAPSDTRAVKSSYVKPEIPTTAVGPYRMPAVEMPDVTDDNHDNDDDDDVDDDDDDAPIFVKVLYDPDAGVLPSEDAIRQAVDDQLREKSGQKTKNDPIVLNYFNRTIQPHIPRMSIRPPQQQLVNRPTLSFSQPTNRPVFRVSGSPQQQNLQLLQREQQQKLQQHQQQQQFKQQQQQKQLEQQLQQQQLLEKQQQHHQQQLKQQQQQKQLEQQLKQQQQQKQLEQQLQQQQLLEQQQQKQLEQQLQQQQLLEQRQQYQRQQQLKQQHYQKQLEQQRQQQQLLEQQQKQLEQQFKQQQALEEQQLKQRQQQQEAREKQQQILLEQQKKQQQLQHFLQQQEQQKQQQRYRQYLLQQQQKQQQLQQQHEQQQLQEQQRQQQLQEQQRQQQLQQQQQEQLLYQQQTESVELQQSYLQQRHENSSLPPMAPRSSRIPHPVRPFFIHQPPAMFASNNNIHAIQHFPLAPVPLRAPQQFQTNGIQRLPNRNISSALATPLPTGLDIYNSRSRKYAPSFFIPINFGVSTEEQSTSTNNNDTFIVPQSLLQRPHTAPASTEMFRPSSALDIPELSKENLSTMLDKIPALHGSQFNIEYAPITEPDGFPIPLALGYTRNEFPDAVVVDKLPKDIIEHVRKSNNPTLEAALNTTVKPGRNMKVSAKSKPPVRKLTVKPSTVLRHAARPRQQVQQSLPGSSDDSSSSSIDKSSSEKETDIEELEISTSSMVSK